MTGRMSSQRYCFIRSTEIWVVPAAAIASLVTSRALLLVLALFLLYRLFQWWNKGILTTRTPIDWPILLLLGLVPITLWATVQPEVTRLQVYRLLSGVALALSLVNGGYDRKSLRYFPVGITIGGIALASLAPFTVEWITDKFSFIPLFVYTLAPLLAADQIHPNVIAGTLTLLLPLSSALLLFGWRQLTQVEKIIYGTGFSLMGVILLFTQSRGALTGFAVATFSLMVLRWGWRAAAPALTLFLLVAYFGKIDTFVDSTALTAVRGWEGRKEIWSRALSIIQDFPFTGIGMGNFGLIADTFYPFFLAAPGQTPHAHNLFLQIAVDLGIPGLIAWLSILLIIFVVSGRLFAVGARSHDGWVAGLGAGLVCSQIALVTHGLTDAVLWGTKPAVMLWAVWGVALVAANLYHPSTVTPVVPERSEQWRSILS